MKKQNILKLQFLFSMLILITCFEVVSISASIENIGSVKQYDCITLPQTCNCTFNNITTIMYPNKSYVTINQVMTQDGTYFNYTFCNTTVIGQYFVNGVGDKDGIITPFNFYFFVTPSGYDASLPQTFSMYLIIGIMLIIGILLFIFGIKVENIPIKLFCLSSTFILVVFLIGYILNISNITIGEFSSLTNGFNSIYLLFIGLLTVWGVSIVVYLIYASLTAFSRMRGLRE